MKNKILVRHVSDYARLDTVELARWILADPNDGNSVGTTDGTYLCFNTKREALIHVKKMGGIPVFEDR